MTSEDIARKAAAAKMKTVCKSLGWKVVSSDDEFRQVYLKAVVDGFPDSSVSFRYGGYSYENRIAISASTKHASSIYRYGEKHLSITVGAERSTDQILKEVQRRFIPTFLEIARKSEEIQKRQDEYGRRRDTCLSRLKGEALEESEKQSGKFNLHLDGIWGDVQYGGDDDVALDIHNVPSEKAARILAILKEKNAAPKEESHVA